MNEWLLALYGWAFFNIILLGFAKDQVDSKKKPFDVALWWQYHWDNVLVTLTAIPLIVVFKVELWTVIVNDWCSKDWAYNDLVLMGAVPVIQLIYFLIRKFAK